MRDEVNPKYMFQGIHGELLAEIVNGTIDPIALAKKELAARGLDKAGKWVGFSASKKIHGIVG